MVLAAHAIRTAGYPEWLKPYSKYLWSGSLGVQIFFVISGFLITHLLLVEQAQTGRIDLGSF
jgi:peptidoglycan/LPS O-acetylase OafA/YrhL